MGRDVGTPQESKPLRLAPGGTNVPMPNMLQARPSGAASPYIVDAYGNGWMGPGGIPTPQAYANEEPRIFDYLAAWNVYRQPASAKSTDGGIDFSILREFSKQTMVRLAIETCKDLDTGTEYVFTLRQAAGEKPGQTRKRAENDKRVQQVTDFFDSPDGKHDFSTWRRLAWEEILVCDNLSLWWRPFNFGAKARGRVPHSLRIIDGDTIEPMLDMMGDEPDEGIAYEQWIKGLPRTGFTAKEMFYRPFNPRVRHVFGHSPVESILWYINILIRRDMKKLAEYTDGNIPAGLWSAPDEWTPTQIAQAQVWLDTLMSGDVSQRAKLIFVPGGRRQPVFPGERVQADAFDDLLTQLVCYAFSVSVSSLLKQHNRATAQVSNSQAEEEGVIVRRSKMTRYINNVIRWAFGYTDIIAVPKQALEQDSEKQSKIDATELESGKKQLNELRDRDGDEPVPVLAGRYFYRNTLGDYVEFVAAGTVSGADARQGLDENGDTAAEDTAATPADGKIPGFAKMAGPFEYASAQVNITGDIAAQILELAASIPDDALAVKGRETDPHITVKFGIDPSVTVAELRSAIGTGASGSLTFGVTAFFAADDYDVVVLTVESDDLKAQNAAITDAVATAKTQANYVPHATLAYVESGRGHEFAGNGSMAGVTFNYRSVYFSDTDGNQTRIQLIGPHTRVRTAAAKLEKKKPHASPYASRT